MLASKRRNAQEHRSVFKTAREKQKQLNYLMDAYRSGHNEAVLKTVRVNAHGGSNPSASAIHKRQHIIVLPFVNHGIY